MERISIFLELTLYSLAYIRRQLIINVSENREAYGKWNGQRNILPLGGYQASPFPYLGPRFLTHIIVIMSGEICFLFSLFPLISRPCLSVILALAITCMFVFLLAHQN